MSRNTFTWRALIAVATISTAVLTAACGADSGADSGAAGNASADPSGINVMPSMSQGASPSAKS